MARLKLTVEYDGRPFSGWQAQPQGNTIQQALEGALFTYLRSEGKKRNITLSETIDITASGRTDAGVSALGQVCHFDLPKGLELDQGMLQQSLNGIVEKSVKVRNIEIVDSSFHSRHSPHSKVYSYRVSLTDYPRAFEPELSYPIGKGVNLARMIDAAREFTGTHNFESFRASDCCANTTQRTINCSELITSGDLLVYRVQGTGFLKQMVRIMVGTLVEVGKGKIESVQKVLQAKDRTQAGQTAPPGPLCLERVDYL